MAAYATCLAFGVRSINHGLLGGYAALTTGLLASTGCHQSAAGPPCVDAYTTRRLSDDQAAFRTVPTVVSGVRVLPAMSRIQRSFFRPAEIVSAAWRPSGESRTLSNALASGSAGVACPFRSTQISRRFTDARAKMSPPVLLRDGSPMAVAKSTDSPTDVAVPDVRSVRVSNGMAINPPSSVV